ncbi:MAG: M48 family metallopeptidase [Pseudomonadales bacterium]
MALEPRGVSTAIPLCLDDLDLMLPVVRGRRKTLALVVNNEGDIECRVPKRCPWRDIEHFVFSNLEWIRRTHHAVAAQARRVRPYFESGAVHYFLGQPYQLQIVPARRTRVKLFNETLELSSKNKEPHQFERSISQWYRDQAERIFAYRLDRLIAQHQIQAPLELKVRKMRAKWGSCSQSGLITLNLWLITQDIRAIDYVILHELCHLSYFNHTSDFYAHLSALMPDWKRRRALLV